MQKILIIATINDIMLVYKYIYRYICLPNWLDPKINYF